MRKIPIRLVIADLDNTLYDWYGAFVPAFYAMVHEAARLTGATEDELLDDLRTVHRRHGNSEHPFALLETHAIKVRFPDATRHELRARLDDAFHAFNRERKSNLRLYEGVRQALEALKGSQVRVVAYTDARVANSLSRLRKLEIKNLIDRVYAPAQVEGDDPRDEDRAYVHLLPPGDKKPNPQVLGDICADYQIGVGETLYIGDSLVRDIFMAKAAGVHAAWAKFGTMYDKSLWPKLVRVTHWTDADVEREQRLRKEAEGIAPDCVLETFSDIFRYYDFGAQHIACA